MQICFTVLLIYHIYNFLVVVQCIPLVFFSAILAIDLATGGDQSFNALKNISTLSSISTGIFCLIIPPAPSYFQTTFILSFISAKSNFSPRLMASFIFSLSGSVFILEYSIGTASRSLISKLSDFLVEM